MLGVVEHLPPLLLQVGDGVPDHAEVLLQRGFEDVVDVQVPAFADDRYDRRTRFEQQRDLSIRLTGQARPSGGTERGNPRVLQRDGSNPAEELHVLGVRPRPAALDEVYADLVEPLGYLKLVFDRE